MSKRNGLSLLHKEKKIGWLDENKNEGSNRTAVDIGKLREL